LFPRRNASRDHTRNLEWPFALACGILAAMTEPRTLLQMAGATRPAAKIADAALLLIDCQREYVDGRLPLVGVAAALAECRRLLEGARAAGAPVVHVVHLGSKGGAFDPEGPHGAVAAEVAPADGESIVAKRLPNAFAGTDLQEVLTRLGRKDIVVGGFMTHMCVSSTVRAALDLGWRTTVVGSAAATRDLPSPAGGIVPAAQLHAFELAALADRFAVVAPDAADCL
jgi:nicotinamidase-related amidase